MSKRWSLFFVLLFLVACQGKELPESQTPAVVMPGDALSLSDKIHQSSFILIADVQRVESWKGRKDWWVVSLRPEKFIKGSANPPLRILSTKLFPNEPLILKEGERVLVFLRELPPYTAWKELRESGVLYDVLGGDQGIFKNSPDISLYSDYAEQVLKIQKMTDKAEREKKLQALFEEVLQKNPPGSIALQITEDYFQLIPANTFSTDNRQFWLTRIKDPYFSDAAKTLAVQKMSEVNSPEMNQALQEMFCLPPAGVCLRVAETLESRAVPLPIFLYEIAVKAGPEDLRIGLLTILARHQRQDGFALFEKYLRQEKNEKNSAALIEAVGDFKTPQAERLVLSYGKDPRYFVQLAVATSLGKLKSSKGIAILENYLKTQNPSMVIVAAQALEQIGTPLALQTLGKYYERGHHGHWEPTEGKHFNLPPANP